MIEAQEILAVDEVKREIRRKDDDVAKWCERSAGSSFRWNTTSRRQLKRC